MVAQFSSEAEATNINGMNVAEAPDEQKQQVDSLSVTLERLPYLAHYLRNQNLKTYPNPLDRNQFFRPSDGFYLTHSDVVLRQASFDPSVPSTFNFNSAATYPRAGPRKHIFFDPSHVRAAIVTSGGLCPGINTVIRELVVGLWELYGVREIFGVKAGYRGFYSAEHPVPLHPKLVDDWHKRGGSVLQTSRGGFHLSKIVDSIQDRAFNQVYVIGGDGTMRGAVKIFEEIRRRKLEVAVVGIPKTVDNDVGIIDRSFGFQTAVEMAQQAISAAHVEAESAVNGIGLVKLMGRSTGHIALHETLSNRDVDCCLIPETQFYLQGKGGLFEFLKQRLEENGHAVVVVAEGTGQDMIPRVRPTATSHNDDDDDDDDDAAQNEQKEDKDESGNPVFLDVGGWLKSEMNKWWKRDHPNELFTMKYIDPTYMIRAVPANATDNLYCTILAHSAIHGVMAGYTGFVTGPVNGSYVYIPLKEVAEARNPVNTRDHKWACLRSVTKQPDFLD